MSGANTAAFWSVKSLWPEWSASGMEDDNLLAEVNTRSVIRMERSLRSGRRMTDASSEHLGINLGFRKGSFLGYLFKLVPRNQIHSSQNQRITNGIREFYTLIQDFKVNKSSIINPGIE
jgi:hypothetical protein